MTQFQGISLADEQVTKIENFMGRRFSGMEQCGCDMGLVLRETRRNAGGGECCAGIASNHSARTEAGSWR